MSAIPSITEAMPLEQGLYYGVPFERYMQIPAVSSSFLRAMRRSPAHALVARDETDALWFGNIVDDLIFNPGAENKYVPCPKVDGRTKAGKLAKDAQQIMANNGMVPLDINDWQQAQQIVAAIRRSKMASVLLDGERQVTVIWRDEDTGVWCKARPDVWKRSWGATVDLKTTENAAPWPFQRSVREYGYVHQQSFYLDGLRACGEEAFRASIVAVEKSAPFAVATYELDAIDLHDAREDNKRLLETYAECQRTGNWPAYADEIQILSLPRY